MQIIHTALLKVLLFGGLLDLSSQITIYTCTNVPHTLHVLYTLSKISKYILRTCLRTFEADIRK